MKLFHFSDNSEDGFECSVCALNREQAIAAVRADIEKWDKFYKEEIAKGENGFKFHLECNQKRIKSLELCISGGEVYPGCGASTIEEFEPGHVI